MQHLTVKEYAKRKNVSEKTVYSWIKKDQVNYTIETVQGRSITYVLVPLVQKEVNEVNEAVYDGKEQNKSSYVESVEHGLNQPHNSELVEFMREMTGYIELAGQAKLLTDSESKTKEEYFRTIQENAQLKAQLDLKEQQLKEFQEKLKTQEESKNSSWWSKL